MIKEPTFKYTINLSFQEIKLPPFQDILILGRNGSQGKLGLRKSFEMLMPNGYEMFEVDHEKVEAVFINKRLLAKLSVTKILAILRERVFDFISDGELIKVDFKLKITMAEIEIEDL
ncbi:hypothetical protein [Mucilaginibacter sp. UYCu711]|uniref:hypothetical protein n=1 Tax=Mucilaginibacter sp. UYCu711 TaxID=3156339 RepID=UPI003D20F878